MKTSVLAFRLYLRDACAISRRSLLQNAMGQSSPFPNCRCPPVLVVEGAGEGWDSMLLGFVHTVPVARAKSAPASCEGLPCVSHILRCTAASKPASGPSDAWQSFGAYSN